MKADQILEEAAKTFRDRQAVYKSNYRQIGTIMKGLFPDGVTLKTEEDHIRFHLFMLMAVKINRYSNNWATGHQDSIRDAAVYAAMVEMVDSEIGPKAAAPEQTTGQVHTDDFYKNYRQQVINEALNPELKHAGNL